MKNLIHKILKEEQDLEWAVSAISDIDYIVENIKWIKTVDGNRFQESSDESTVWQRFRGWGRWFRVQGTEIHNGVLCFITSLDESSNKPRYFYYTPVEDYDNHTMSFSNKKPDF